MISEPEMAGDFGPPVGGDVVGGVDGPASHAPQARKPWAWALGGVVVASAVWAGGLYAYGSAHHQGPEGRGYTMGANLCDETALTALSSELGSRDRTSEVPLRLNQQHVLDRGACFIELAPGGARTRKGWWLSYTVNVAVSLHTKTDPRAEFEAQPAGDDASLRRAAKVEEVPGLGDEAYLMTEDDGGQSQELRVLDGGAVFVLNLASDVSYAGNNPDSDEGPGAEHPAQPELKSYEPAMISDLKALMERLRSGHSA
ncbi:hypothetical protein [Streptomyces sp. NBC_00344]|uniref:hypothetical protein n=1 Tax=Streptomyces sp. NBC_00344 TaxID=2975720 RepID=UPI002E21BFDE